MSGQAATISGGELSARRRAWNRFIRRRDAVVAACFLLVLVIVAVIGPWLVPRGPDEQNLWAVLSFPTSDNWLGTDSLGRDVLSRVVSGARVALVASLEAVAVATVIGVPIGLFIGYRGGWWDRVMMRVVEGVVAIPGLVLAIAALTIVGTGLTNAMLAIGVVFAMSFLRLTRGAVLATREELYVDASKVIGTADRTIVVRHVLPNVAAPLIVQATLAFGAALLAEAGLSFLGLGVQPPQASWGSMLAESAPHMRRNWFIALPPGLAIAFTVLAFNVLGDAIRDSIGRGVEPAQLRRATVRPTSASVSGAPRRATRVAAGGVTPTLEVRDLAVSFRSPRGVPVEAVSGVSFDIAPGETLGLVGESGCGKSATALAIAGLLPASAVVRATRVAVGGREVAEMSARELRSLRGGDVGVVFQDPMTSLNPAYTVGVQLEEALRLHAVASRRARRGRALELLDLVRIRAAERVLKAYPHELSGGMAQRVMIAMALSCEPRLLIADEPTTALDVTVQGQVLDLLRDIQSAVGTSILFITHDLGVVADICDRAAVMYAGELVEVADVQTLLHAPLHPYTRALIESRPDRDAKGGRLPTIPGAVPAPGDWPSGCRFMPRCAEAIDGCERRQLLGTTGADQQVRCWRSTASFRVSAELEGTAR